MGQYCLINNGTGSLEGGTGWYLVVVGQYGAVLVRTWWYWVSMEWNWLVYDDCTRSVKGGTG